MGRTPASDAPKVKYVAVYWVGDKQFTVQNVSCIQDPEMLRNPELIGDVEHQGKKADKPPAGWKTYPGKIIALGEKKRDVSEKAKAKYLAMVEAEAKADAIMRQASITASSSSDDFSSSSSDKSLTPVSSSKGRTTSPCLSGELQSLKDKVLQLESMVTTLRLEKEDLIKKNLLLQAELPALLGSLQRGQLLRHTFSSSRASSPAQSESSDGSCDSSFATNQSFSSNSTTGKDLNSFISQAIIDDAMLGNSTKWTKATTELMNKLFTEEELRTCSYSGAGTGKPGLPKDKRDALLRFLLKTFHGLKPSEVSNKIGYTLRDYQKNREKKQVAAK